jgi:hypothetical protein
VSRPRPALRIWTSDERQVIDRFAHAIVEGRYRHVKDAVPECQRELRQVAPESPRTDTAVAWRVLCRAYDFGLPRRKHLFTNQESRRLNRYASGLVRGKYPNAGTAARRYMRACERAGIAVHHQFKSVHAHITALARAKGYVPVSSRPRLSPEEICIIDGLSLAVSRDVYPNGSAAVGDCIRALTDAGVNCLLSKRALARRINAGARNRGWVSKHGPWNVQDVRTMQRFARALAAGRYPTIAAAARACRRSLERAGRLETQEGNRVAPRIRHFVLAVRGKQFRPRWQPDELRILDRFARALVRGEYTTPGAARAQCRRALDLAGLTGHRARNALESKFHQRVQDIRRYNAWLRQHRKT